MLKKAGSIAFNSRTLHKTIAFRNNNDAFKQVIQKREYFSLMEKIRKGINVPMRHIQSFFEPDGIHYVTQLPNPANTHGNTNMTFTAYLTGNSYDMNVWHEMENTVHTNFGTVDNPVLIFTSDASWRMVMCMGPGSEDDSHTHERMYYFLREGPMNRCHLCGQCFKLVRLKDEYSDINDYYTTMFAKLRNFEVTEEDITLGTTHLFSDRPQAYMQHVPGTYVYIQVNSDEADRMLVDPAYKLERTKEAHEKLYALQEAYIEIERQMSEVNDSIPIPYGREMYETWWKIELAIRKFDRWFNKVEKFESRKFTDPDNHERREKRMLEEKRKRLVENFTFYKGKLTEQEQMYRDYYQTDLETDPENEYVEDQLDEAEIAATGDFKQNRFDFIETGLMFEPHEGIQSRVDTMIFKYKYRRGNDSAEVYHFRENRVIKRFFERAKTRDPRIEKDIFEIFEKERKNYTLANFALNDKKFYEKAAMEETKPIREYMLNESIQQFKDYFEDDAEEMRKFEYIDNLPNRDKLRFLEIFHDYTIDPNDYKEFVTITKREYNPELSFFSNFMLDLVDFKDRVRPLARDLALRDKSQGYQRISVKQFEKAQEGVRKIIKSKGYDMNLYDLVEGKEPYDVEKERIKNADKLDAMDSTANEIIAKYAIKYMDQLQNLETDEEIDNFYETANKQLDADIEKELEKYDNTRVDVNDKDQKKLAAPQNKVIGQDQEPAKKLESSKKSEQAQKVDNTKKTEAIKNEESPKKSEANNYKEDQKLEAVKAEKEVKPAAKKEEKKVADDQKKPENAQLNEKKDEKVVEKVVEKKKATRGRKKGVHSDSDTESNKKK